MRSRTMHLFFAAVLTALVAVAPACSRSNTTTDQAPRQTPEQSAASKPNLASISLAWALTSGKPTLAEFGWKEDCVPCKMMEPLLEELALEYEGKVNVVILRVYEQLELARQYGIIAMPTQIFFDNNGKEIARHMGFWPKEKISAQLKGMGIE